MLFTRNSKTSKRQKTAPSPRGRSLAGSGIVGPLGGGEDRFDAFPATALYDGKKGSVP